MAGCWILLREPGHSERADEAEVDPFARRVLAELVRDNLMTEKEAIGLCKRIRREIIGGRSAKVLH